MSSPYARLRIALIASSRYPIAEPFAGGLEAQTWLTAQSLSRLGHAVTLFAAPGSDPHIARHHHSFDVIASDGSPRRDLSEDAGLVAAEAHSYRRLMVQLIQYPDAFDIVHNNSLHELPVSMAARLGVPMVTTLHTPPIVAVEQAMAAMAPGRASFVAVSRHTARSWAGGGQSVAVIHNGVDTETWPAGPGGGPVIWSGRIAPEKGAHLAIEAARCAGLPIDLAGPVIDDRYFQAEIRPRLGPEVRYLGHLRQDELARRVGRARVAVVTPRWDEPYGLVVAEALSCGTPVVAFARGGIPEIVNSECARLVAPDDVAAMARAIPAAAGLSRVAARHRAVSHCSSAGMVRAYEGIYRDAIAAGRSHPAQRAPAGHRARLVRR